MPRRPLTGILTDSTALFDREDFPGHDLVDILRLDLVIDEKVYPAGQGLKDETFPAVVGLGRRVQTLAPSPATIRRRLQRLGQQFHDMVVLTSGHALTGVFAHALEASAGTLHRLHLQVWDSQTFGFALGWAVEEAAAMAQNGATAREIITHLRRLRTSFYTVIAVQSLSYLHASGLLDPAQAMVGEMLGITPLLLLEEGRLLPLYKARSTRHLLDLLQEFGEEFASLRRVALLAGSALCHEAETLRQRLEEIYPHLHIACVTQNFTLRALFGPRMLALFVQE